MLLSLPKSAKNASHNVSYSGVLAAQRSPAEPAQRSVKQDGDAEARKCPRAAGFASADSRASGICRCARAVSTSSGKLAQVGHFVAQHQRRLRPGKAAIHLASLPRIGRIALEPQAVISKLRAHLRFLRLQTQDAAQLPRNPPPQKTRCRALHHRDADGIQFAGPANWRDAARNSSIACAAPAAKDLRQIFGNHAEARAGLRARDAATAASPGNW